MTTGTALKIGFVALGVKLTLGAAMAGWWLYHRHVAGENAVS